MPSRLGCARRTTVLAVICAPGLLASAQAGEWRRLVAANEVVALTLPREWSVFEHPIRPADDAQPPSTLIRIVCGPAEQEPNLGMAADVELHLRVARAEEVPEGERASAPGPAGRLVAEEPVALAGHAGVLREIEWAEGQGRFLTVEAVVQGWKLHLSARSAVVPRQLFLRLLAGTEIRPGTSGSRAGAATRQAAVSPSQQHLVRAVYLRPTDWPERPDYSLVIGKAFQHVQLWFQDQMGGGVTFVLRDPIVEALSTGHNSAWYSENPVPGTDQSLYFWRNVLADAFALTPGRFWDPSNRWIYYIGAGPSCGQIGGAGTSGVSILPINDLKGLTRQRGAWPCSWEQWVDYSVCRWVGGLAHELGHSWDVPHPPGCEDSDPGTPCPDTLMYGGYLVYPDTGLLESEKVILRNSTYFDVQDLHLTRFGCTKLFSAPGW